MKKLTLALLATAALCLPAVAQQQPQPSGPSRNEMNTQQQTSTSFQQQGQISPQSLDKQQISQIQQSLGQKGFSPGRADGKWGPKTRAAFEKFQKKEGMQANGTLDQQTLSDLGVNVAQGNQQGGGMQTGRSVSSPNQPSASPQKQPNAANTNQQPSGAYSNQPRGQ